MSAHRGAATVQGFPTLVATGSKALFMNDLPINGLEPDLMAKLADRAAKQGRSIEEEARDILRIVLYQASDTGESLLESIQARGCAIGVGFDLELPPRETIRDP